MRSKIGDELIMNGTGKGKVVREKILESIIAYIKEHRYSPTVREIGEMVGLKSPSSVQEHLSIMLANGTIETDGNLGSPRTIRVPGYKYVCIGGWIPCSERLPEKDGKYLVTYCDDLVDNYVIERNFYNGSFEPMSYSEKHTGRKAIAWQPLPEPYMEGETV